jgi:diaminopimelate epimerase
MEMMIGGLSVSKHHGAGNDFLIVIDLENQVQLTDDEVRRLADRHFGLGADGVILVSGGTGGGEVTMSLRNSDGSFAEISGNGLRCVVHEVVRSGIVAPGDFSVMTGAGLRRVSCSEPDGLRAWTSADMGTLILEDLDPTNRKARVNVGNPHLVIAVDDVRIVDVAGEGARLQEELPGGINVEWIHSSGEGRLEMVVYERGVGPTLACGSGSCAAAFAARALGLSGDKVVVENPGGPLEVSLSGDGAVLSGEVTLIADSLFPLERIR